MPFNRSEPVKVRMTLSEFMRDELPALADIVTFSNHLPMSLYADTTVVKTPEVVYRGVATSRTTLVAQEYLLNFRRGDADLGFVLGTNNFKLPMVAGALAARDLEDHDEHLVRLPPSRNERAPIGPLIRSRRSTRRYSGAALRIQELSTVLAHAAGVTGHISLSDGPATVTTGDDPQLDLRAVASGGALYPIDLFVVATNVETLAPGAYRYLPRPHALKAAAAGDGLPDTRTLAQFSEIEAEKASCLIVYVYNFFENSRKYGEAGLGFAFIEAGAIAAHIHLLCTALGLGSCDVGGFAKRRLERLLEVDGLSRHVIHLTVIGK
jgi:SagB-type dehydrogenase family enzyme